MITTDFETRQPLASEHRDQLARDMRLARRTRQERSSLLSARGVLRRAHESIRSLPKVTPSRIRRPQEVSR